MPNKYKPRVEVEADIAAALESLSLNKDGTGTFGLLAFPGELFRVGIPQSYMADDGEELILYTQRLCGDDGWKDFAKGNTEELRGQMVGGPRDSERFFSGPDYK